MSGQAPKISLRKILVFWFPLASTWLMMATEGPFLAAIIARMAKPKYNLAAFGIAYSFAVLIEAPVIMMVSASTALAKDRQAFLKLRNFTYALNGIVTAVMLVLVLSPIFYLVTSQFMGLPDEVTLITHRACLTLLLWPGAIGYRRFYQGILIRNGFTRRVALGTVVRLSTMVSVSVFSFRFLNLDGAVVGAAALVCSVSAEALATRLFATRVTKSILKDNGDHSGSEGLSYRSIFKFYSPLALTSLVSMGVHPMITFFMGQSRLALDSLAVLPVINSLVFLFRSLGLSFQEAAIALLGDRFENLGRLALFSLLLGLFAVTGLAVIAFTPLSSFWFERVSGLSPELSRFAVLPTRILSVLPGLTVLISFQRGILVIGRRTVPVTVASTIEVMIIFCLLAFTIHSLDWIGILSAATAFIIGRIMANGYLMFPCLRSLASAKTTSARRGISNVH